MLSLLKKQAAPEGGTAIDENDFSEAGLRNTLFTKLDAFESHGGRDFSYMQNPEIWGVDLAARPLYLLWDGDPKYFLTMRYFLGLYDVRSIVGGGLHIIPNTEEGFRADAKNIPGLTAVIFGDEERYANMCRELDVPFAYSWYADQFAAGNKTPYNTAPYVRENLAILDELGDEFSKRTLMALMLYRMSMRPKWLEPFVRPMNEMYFQPDIPTPFKFAKDEVFLDGGASLGDTIDVFNQLTDKTYGHIHACEPSPVAAGIMRRMFDNDEKISIYEVGLSDKAGTIGFTHEIVECAGTVNGAFDRNSSTRIRLEAIDMLDLGKVDLIKFDIEGAEVPALEGGRETIKKYKPKLAICAYHKPDDFSTIYNKIKSIRDDYTIYLRHYAPTDGDSVFYAV